MDTSGRVDIDFVVLGAQKSASTFLHRCLAEHPQVEMPQGESRHFEDPYFDQGAVAELTASFGPRVEGVRRGIKRPDYLARPVVAGRLARALPEARLLVVLREPVGRAVSAYVDYVRLGFAPLMEVDRAFEQILDGSMQRRYPRVADVLDYGRYGRHLSRYLQVYPRSQLLVLMQEDIVADPLSAVRTAFDFLQVDASFRPPSLERRSNRGVYSPRRLRLLRSRNRFLFTYDRDLSRREPRRPGPLGLAWVATATAVDRFVLGPTDTTTRPVLGAQTRRRLEEYYEPDLAVLETILDRPLDSWRTTP